MSSPKTRARRRFLALAAVLPLLAGCSFSPLYGENGGASAGRGFAYADPANRIEQIIYQELAFRLGTDDSPDARRVTISASQADRRLGRTSPSSVLSAHEAVVNARLVVTAPGVEGSVLTADRFASASFEKSGQVAADRAASKDAGEKAARAVADTLRLILAAADKNGDI